MANPTPPFECKLSYTYQGYGSSTSISAATTNHNGGTKQNGGGRYAIISRVGSLQKIKENAPSRADVAQSHIIQNGLEMKEN